MIDVYNEDRKAMENEKSNLNSSNSHDGDNLCIDEVDTEDKDDYISPTGVQFSSFQKEVINTALKKNCFFNLAEWSVRELICSTVIYNYYSWFPKKKVIFLSANDQFMQGPYKTLIDYFDTVKKDVLYIKDNDALKRAKYKLGYSPIVFITYQLFKQVLDEKSFKYEDLSYMICDTVEHVTYINRFIEMIDKLKPYRDNFTITAITWCSRYPIARVQKIVSLLGLSCYASDLVSDGIYRDMSVENIIVTHKDPHCVLLKQIEEMYNHFGRKLKEASLLYQNLGSLSSGDMSKRKKNFLNNPPRGLSTEEHNSIADQFESCIVLLTMNETLRMYGVHCLNSYLLNEIETFPNMLKQISTYEVFHKNLSDTMAHDPERNFIHPKLTAMKKKVEEHVQSQRSENNDVSVLIYCEVSSQLDDVFYIVNSFPEPSIQATVMKNDRVFQQFLRGTYNIMVVMSMDKTKLSRLKLSLAVFMGIKSLRTALSRADCLPYSKCIVFTSPEEQEEYFSLIKKHGPMQKNDLQRMFEYIIPYSDDSGKSNKRKITADHRINKRTKTGVLTKQADKKSTCDETKKLFNQVCLEDMISFKKKPEELKSPVHDETLDLCERFIDHFKRQECSLQLVYSDNFVEMLKKLSKLMPAEETNKKTDVSTDDNSDVSPFSIVQLPYEACVPLSNFDISVVLKNYSLPVDELKRESDYFPVTNLSSTRKKYSDCKITEKNVKEPDNVRGSSSKKRLILSDEEDSVIMFKPRVRRRIISSSDSSSPASSKSPKSSPISRTQIKNMAKLFIDDEAECSQVTNTQPEVDDYSLYENSFIDDSELNNDSNMMAVYLKSIRSPIVGKRKKESSYMKFRRKPELNKEVKDNEMDESKDFTFIEDDEIIEEMDISFSDTELSIVQENDCDRVNVSNVTAVDDQKIEVETLSECYGPTLTNFAAVYNRLRQSDNLNSLLNITLHDLDYNLEHGSLSTYLCKDGQTESKQIQEDSSENITETNLLTYMELQKKLHTIKNVTVDRLVNKRISLLSRSNIVLDDAASRGFIIPNHRNREHNDALEVELMNKEKEYANYVPSGIYNSNSDRMTEPVIDYFISRLIDFAIVYSSTSARLKYPYTSSMQSKVKENKSAEVSSFCDLSPVCRLLQLVILYNRLLQVINANPFEISTSKESAENVTAKPILRSKAMQRKLDYLEYRTSLRKTMKMDDELIDYYRLTSTEVMSPLTNVSSKFPIIKLSSPMLKGITQKTVVDQNKSDDPEMTSRSSNNAALITEHSDTAIKVDNNKNELLQANEKANFKYCGKITKRKRKLLRAIFGNNDKKKTRKRQFVI